MIEIAVNALVAALPAAHPRPTAKLQRDPELEAVRIVTRKPLGRRKILRHPNRLESHGFAIASRNRAVFGSDSPTAPELGMKLEGYRPTGIEAAPPNFIGIHFEAKRTISFSRKMKTPFTIVFLHALLIAGPATRMRMIRYPVDAANGCSTSRLSR